MPSLIGLGVISVLELLLWTKLLWRIRKVAAPALLIALSVVSGLIAGAHFSVWALVLLFLSLYRVINLLRLVEDRTQTDHLFNVSRTTALWLMGLQLIILGLAGLNHIYRPGAMLWLYALAAAQLFLSGVLAASTRRHLRTTLPPAITDNYADRDLPTLSVCIPARNETDDLDACLQSLVTSSYPKLEILVLDDCSQNKHTPEIIRSFAHTGVRFIAGDPPPQHWLAKSYAYEQLARAANGEILLFCGVDTRFRPQSLRLMVEALLEKRKTMLSFVPRNLIPSARPWLISDWVVQPGRYAWELALPRRWLNRPPVLSTCWLIKAEQLKAAGGFEAVSHSTSPESYFARQAVGRQDGYAFLQSDEAISLISAKSFTEQRATAVRTRYPQTHRRPEIVALLTLAALGALLTPFVVLIAAAITQRWALGALSLLTCILLTVFYAAITKLTYRRFLLRGLWLLPLAALYDSGLLNYSMWQYEFREVIWKGRNVCIPVMRTVASQSSGNPKSIVAARD